MTTTDTTKSTDTSLTRGWLQLAGYYLGNRWVLLGLEGLLFITGLLFRWGWLVAAGIAPILLALAPCAIMCGLGLCSMKMMGGSK